MLLGQDHLAADQYAMCSVGTQRSTVCSISLGGVDSVSRKGGTQVPNEDGLFAADFGDRAFHAVADGHKGHNASHWLIRRVHRLVTGAKSVNEPLRHFGWLAIEETEADSDPSRTTASLCSIDRTRGIIEGWSVGDSAVFLLSVERGVTQLNQPQATYIFPLAGPDINASQVSRFEHDVRPGEVVLTCTDGVFECNYGSPATSITPAELEALFIRYSSNVDAFVEAVTRDALMGVRGNPGGQDNIAIVATHV